MLDKAIQELRSAFDGETIQLKAFANEAEESLECFVDRYLHEASDDEAAAFMVVLSIVSVKLAQQLEA